MKLKGKKVTIRVALGTLFVLVTATTIAVAVSLQYYFYKKSELDNTLLKYHNISSHIKTQLLQLDKTAVGLIDKAALSFDIFDISIKDQDQLLKLFTTILSYDDNIYSTYLADDQENLFQVINLNAKASQRKIASETDENWLVVDHYTTSEGRNKTLYFYDNALKLTRSMTVKSNLIPSLRPWFQDARVDTVNKTEPYLFNHLNISGQTYSKRIQNTNLVVGLDYTLPTIQSYLKRNDQAIMSEKSFEAYLFLEDGRLVATNQDIKIDQDLPVTQSLNLTEAQKTLINRTPPLTVSSQLDWEPIDFAVSGHPYGYAIDLMNLISLKTGLKFNYINGLDWEKLVQQFDQGHIDLLHSVATGSHSERPNPNLLLPMYSLPYALAVTNNDTNIETLQQTQALKVGVLEGWTILNQFKQALPLAQFNEYPTLSAALEELNQGIIDAVLDNALVLDKKISTLAIKNSSVMPISAQILNDTFSLKVKPLHADLLPIISQALDSITDEKGQQYLRSKWMRERPIYTHIPYESLLELSKAAQNHGTIQEITLNGEHFYLFLEKLATSEQQIVAILIKKQQILDSVNQRIYYFLSYSLIILFLLLPVVWVLAIPVVRPIKEIERQSKLIAQRRYHQIELIPSRIKETHQLSDSMCSMATALHAYEKEQQLFVDSFIKLVADAIDEKSPYTGSHCMRVPDLAMMLMEKVQNSDSTEFDGFSFKTRAEWREFEVAAWLHDCGKITTPEYVVDKATKLETNYNRIHEIRTRFEVLWRDEKIAALESQLNGTISDEEAEKTLSERFSTLSQQFEFIAQANIGGEFMSDESIKKIVTIGQQTWYKYFDDSLGLSSNELERYQRQPLCKNKLETLLSDKLSHLIKRERDYQLAPDLGIDMEIPEHMYNLGEIYNLTIRRGTLTVEERFKINEHMISGIKMLNNIPFPPDLERVPRYATTHHETLKGTGYPRKLSAQDLSIPERVLAIADVFEALTASDRPYKQPKTISAALDILHNMVKDNHLDSRLFKLFIQEKVYLIYAQQYLKPAQIDEINIDKYLTSTNNLFSNDKTNSSAQ